MPDPLALRRICAAAHSGEIGGVFSNGWSLDASAGGPSDSSHTVRACMRACVRAYVRACVRACVRAWAAHVRARAHACDDLPSHAGRTSAVWMA
jgi:hypothetical protein